MSDADIFGALVVPTQIGDAVTGTLMEWITTYLAVVERAVGIDPANPSVALPAPQSYTTTDDPDHWPEDEPPAVVVVIPGTLTEPKRDGTRSYRAEWDVRICTYVSSNDRVNTERLAKYYAAAVRLCILQKASPPGGVINATMWLGEQYDRRMNNLAERTLGYAEVRFSVDVRGAGRALGGPLSPPLDPTQAPADWPSGTNVTVDLAPEALQ